MANNQANNAPFLSQNNYDDVAGVSNSPFTDQRAAAAGGGGSGSAGNMVFTPDGATNIGKISYDNAGTPAGIAAIDQTTDFISLRNNGNDIALQPNGQLNITSDQSVATVGETGVVSTATNGPNVLQSTNNNVLINANNGTSSVTGNFVSVDAADALSLASTNNTNINSSTGNVSLGANNGTVQTIAGSATITASSNVNITGDTVSVDATDALSLESTNNTNINSVSGNVSLNANNGAVQTTADSAAITAAADVTVTGATVELNSANATAAVQVDDGSSSVNVIADDTFRAEVGGNAFPLLHPYDSLVDLTGSNIDMQVIDARFTPDTRNKTARLQLIEPNALNESEIKMEASEIDLISYASVTNGISLQTRDINGGIISEFALNSSQANNVPPAVVGRNVQYFQFATRDPGFQDPPPDPLQPTYRFSTNTGAWRFIDRPNAAGPSGGPLQWNGEGDGSQATPYELSFANAGVNSLSLDYDQTTSVLTLSDPVDGDISNTVITSGRTVLLDDVSVTGTSEVSCIGLSNTVFPPPASTILVGNNPPRVEIPTSGVTPWFPGASFRATLGGTIDTVINNDNLVLTIYSNRGQASQQILNTFNLNLEDSSDIGWKWDIFFTCRSVNASPALGVIACNSKFDYTQDGGTPTPEGFISNETANFDTSVDQYLDFTMQFQQANNELTTNLFIIERIY